MKYDAFISYSRSNLETVKAIKDEIERTTGIKCWMDLEGIESGAPRFTKSIIDGINQCQIFLFMYSAQSQSSEFALRELNFAGKRCPHIVIVHIDTSKMNDEFEFLYGLTDAIDWNNLPQREKLIRDVKKWTGDYRKEMNVSYDKIDKRKKENSPKRWICYSCGKSWTDSVADINKTKCPYCSSMSIAEVNSTKVQHNHSPKKWICYSCGKSWTDSVADNNKTKCPYCGSMSIAKVNKL